MDDPIQDITGVVHRLTQGSPKQQEEAINEYFTEDASFTHPFCRTGSFDGSRYLIHQIFQWYKIMSPRIDLNVNGVAFDEQNLILYVNISQVFAIWFIPFHRSPVTLTTQLQLVRKPSSRKYYIQSQNDLYQTDQFVKFFAPWGIGSTIVILWQIWATFFCVILAHLGSPVLKFTQSQWVKKQQARGSSTNGVAEWESRQDDMRRKGEGNYMDARGVKELMSVGTTPSRVNGGS